MVHKEGSGTRNLSPSPEEGSGTRNLSPCPTQPIPSLRQHQKRAAQALKILGEICQEKGIEFFLLAGSALGAVRHKGFIPWDDDIDVGMTIENLRAFEKIMDKHAMGEFRISHCLNNKKHPRLFAKIIYEGEHCIDIFPVVRTSDNMLKRKSQWFFRNLFYRLYLTKIRAFNPTRLSRKIKLKMAEFVCLFLSRKNIIRLARWNETRFEKRKTNCYINLYSIYSMEKEIIKSEWVEELAPVEFEGREYMAFKNTHDYLTHLYGDYMTLPPEEERKPSHSDLIIEF